MNHLTNEKSPYLLQHASNPVEWYPWGEEAFERAIAEDKPIFLSIGYSTCHWCHVMAHESFEDKQVAALMNETFINIKADREERPDIDNTYMTVCQMITGQGGWPLTVILTPDKQPFYAATYIPKHSFNNRIGMLDFVPAIAKTWQTDRDRVSETAQRISEGFRKTLDLGQSRASVTTELIDQTIDQLNTRFDPEYGGFGSAPKFPSPHNILFLLNHFKITGSPDSLHMAEKTLNSMRSGGIWDHIGYGFHRYATDQQWLLPHFEKMLHDQALLLMAYTEAWQITKHPLFKQTAYEISAYVKERLTSPGGGFYSAEDADSEGEEGKFYLWTSAEIRKLLSPEESELLLTLYNFEENGNYQDEVTGGVTGKNIPHLIQRPKPDKTQDESEGIQPGRLKIILETLRSERNKRERPFLDDKILTDWNGLMIAALARAGTVFDDPDFIRSAENAWKHINDHCFDGISLKHLLKDGEASIEGMADDYAFLIYSLIQLYQSTFESEYLKSAIDLQKRFDQLFYDDDYGGYFFTSNNAERLMGRQKEIYDGAVPSSNSVSVLNNYYLAAITGSADYKTRAENTCTAFSEQMTDAPAGYTFAIHAFQLMTASRAEIIITSSAYSPEVKKLTDSCRNNMPAGSVILLLTEQNRSQVHALAPFTRSYNISDKPMVYICKNYSCKRPVTTPEEVVEILEKQSSQRG